MTQVPRWRLEGDWFDVCSCYVPCPCSFAQAPTNDACDVVLAYHVRRGTYGDVSLDDMNVLAIADFSGNLWGGETKMNAGIFVDDRADPKQAEALQAIFGGQAGGWPAALASLIGELRGVEAVPLRIEVDEALGGWRADIPGKLVAHGTALSGPTSRGLVQMTNPPGSEVGPLAPGAVVTWGQSTAHYVDAFGFHQDYANRSSKHMPFAWSGPDEG